MHKSNSFDPLAVMLRFAAMRRNSCRVSGARCKWTRAYDGCDKQATQFVDLCSEEDCFGQDKLGYYGVLGVFFGVLDGSGLEPDVSEA